MNWFAIFWACLLASLISTCTIPNQSVVERIVKENCK